MALLVPAAGFAGASLTHLELILPGNPDRTAATADGIIAAVLVLGAVAAVAVPRGGRAMAQGVLVIALIGDLVGLGITLLATPERVADILFHVAIAIVVAVAMMAVGRGPARLRPQAP